MLRRNFIKSTALAGVAGMSGAYSMAMPTGRINPKKITIQSVDSNFEREPLIRPFGFKGIYQKEFWTATLERSRSFVMRYDAGSKRQQKSSCHSRIRRGKPNSTSVRREPSIVAVRSRSCFV